MKYKMYRFFPQFGLILGVSFLAACATSGVKTNTAEEEIREPASRDDSNIREPASLVGHYDWLNEVQDDFSRIADETSSNRGVASRQPDILVQKTRWTFLFNPVTNKFSLKLDGNTYGMIQTSLEDSENFSFAAEGQTENPVTLTVAVTSSEDRAPAQSSETINVATGCGVELNFWDKVNKKYHKDSAAIQGDRCSKVVSQLRSYVP